MTKIDVRYNGALVGHTYDGKTIEFNDSEDAKIVIRKINQGKAVGISSRKLGLVNEYYFIRYNKQ